MENQLINEQIKSHTIVLIDSSGVNKGEFLKSEALKLAKSSGLDLVQVGEAKVPICKIMDHGKMIYKKQKQERHKNKSHSLKEIRFKYAIGEHDLEVKKKHIKEFLAAQHKVLVAMQLGKGREKYVTKEIALAKFLEIVREFEPEFVSNNVSENDNGFNYTLIPHK